MRTHHALLVAARLCVCLAIPAAADAAILVSFEDGNPGDRGVQTVEVGGFQIAFQGAQYINPRFVRGFEGLWIGQAGKVFSGDPLYPPIRVTFNADAAEVSVLAFPTQYGNLRASLLAFDGEGQLLGSEISEPFAPGGFDESNIVTLTVRANGIRSVVLDGAVRNGVDGNTPLFDNLTVTPTAIPEPSTSVLALAGLVMLARAMRAQNTVT